MKKRIALTFLLLVLLQELHSIEEYYGELWEVFPPATYLSGLVSDNLRNGFLIINIVFFLFGLWCWFFPVRKGYSYASGLIWLWIFLEMINSIGHTAWSLNVGAYVPGMVTAVVILIIVIDLTRLLLVKNKS